MERKAEVERSAEAAKIANEWLPKVAAGEALLAVAQPSSPLVPEAHVADLLILPEMVEEIVGLAALEHVATRLVPDA